MDNTPYHVTIYLHPSGNCDSGTYYADYNARLTGDELIAFNHRVAEICEKVEADYKKAQERFRERQRELQKQGKSTWNEGIGPLKPEFSVTVVRLEDSVIDGTKLMEEFDQFAISEGLWE